MHALKAMARFLVIVKIIVCYGLDEALPRRAWALRCVSMVGFFWPRRRANLTAPLSDRLRLALIELGPLFIKFGQALSTRHDMLSPAMVASLSTLQSQVPTVCSDWVVAEVERTLGALDSNFSAFDRQPLAAASIAQVHAATLLTGESVVVKVLRPQIHAIVARDMRWLQVGARWLQRWSALGKRLRLVAVVAEFKQFTENELDLRREAANASQIRRAFEHSSLLYIPQVHWPWCHQNIMVMERIQGVPVHDIDTMQARGVDRPLLARRGVEIFFTQVLRDRFFHADMHPGNIFVNTEQPHEPRYIAVDFGIMGTLSAMDQRYLAENMLAFFKQDYARVAQLHVDSGWVPPGCDVRQFEATIRMVCEPIFQQPLSRISLGGLLLKLFQTAREFDMVVQPQLVLLQKTLLSIEGLGRQIDPDLDLWATAQPQLAAWLRQQVGVKALWRQCQSQSPFWWQSWLQLPSLAAKWAAATAAPPTAPLPRRRYSGWRPVRFAVLLVGLTVLAASWWTAGVGGGSVQWANAMAALCMGALLIV